MLPQTLPQMLPARSIVLVMLSLSGLGCIGQGPTDGDEKTARIAGAQARWRGAALSNYSFNSRVVCFCPSDYVTVLRVTVRGGEVMAVVETQSGQARPLTWRQPVDSLFAIALREARSRPAGLDATFDDVLGYPRRLSYGFDERIADAGAVVTIDSLRADP